MQIVNGSIFDIMTDKLMGITDILNMLKKANVKVSRPTFYRWILSGYFPPQTLFVGGQRRWSESTVKGWLDQCVKDAKK